MNSELRRLKSVPTIARIVIRMATLRRSDGSITEAVFLEQIRRITREELAPGGLTLLVRDLPNGRTRFIFKENATGIVCDMMEFTPDGLLEVEDSAPLPQDESLQQRDLAPAPSL